MKILLMSFAVSPFRGSEFSVAWNYITEMSKHHEIFVLYGTSGDKTLEDFGNTSEMQNWLASNSINNVHFIDIHVKRNWWIKFNISLFKYNGVLPYYVMYKNWHKEVYRKAQELVASEKIDLIHYLSPIGFKEPGYCWKIKNIPYVWGPMQAVENRPIPLFKVLSIKGLINALVRRLIHNTAFVFSPRVRKAIKRADVIFSATPNTQKMLMHHYAKQSVYLPENGIVQMKTSLPIQYDGQNVLNIIWVGLIGERKALRILIESLAKINNENWHLTVCGNGPEKEKMMQLSRMYGINRKIDFMGNLPRSEVQKHFAKSHLHIVSSLGEGNPTTIWEAMSWGVPTLTLDHCGMSGVVCEKCGIKIPIVSYKQVVDDMAKHIQDLITHPNKVELLSAGVLECSKVFMWQNRVDLYNRIYAEIVSKYKK